MHQPFKSNQPRHLLVEQRVLGLLVLIIMLLWQAAAAGAGQDQGSIWIKISGGAGTAMVQPESKAPPENYTHCVFCDDRLTASYAGCTTSDGFAPAYGLTGFQLCSGTAVFITEAEQYWAASRGPPLGNETTFMLDYLSLVSKESAISSPVLRGALWL